MGSSEVILKIGVLVFNHERFIKQALESILKQKTNYKFQVMAFDDCSSDRSYDVMMELAALYPEQLKVFRNSKNLGDFWNLRSNFSQLDSKYVALLDGDDYWDNETKIEKMVTYLEGHPGAVATSHNVRLLFDNQSTKLLNPKPFDRSEHTVEDLISGYCYHHTSALIYRNVFKGKLPEAYFNPKAGDWFMSMLFAEHGYIKYFDETWSAYRIHENGFWSRFNEHDRQMMNIDSMVVYNRLLKYRYRNVFSRIYFLCRSFLRRCPKTASYFPFLLKYFFLMLSIDTKENKLRLISPVFKYLYNELDSILIGPKLR